MGNYFSEMNCIKATVIKETNNDTYFDEVKKDENIPEEVKEANPICDNNEGLSKKEESCDKKECCDIEDCCKNQESCDKKDCPKKEYCYKKKEE
jgi:hypothetical protein